MKKTTKKELLQKLRALSKAIKAIKGYYAQLDEECDYYLLRFAKYQYEEDGSRYLDWSEDFLVLMHDFGVTWEPCRAYPTACYCKVNIDKPELCAKQLVKLLDAYIEQTLPDKENSGYKVLCPDHKLEIKSLNDAKLSCSCGNWNLTLTGEMTKRQAGKAHRDHLKNVVMGFSK